jgi:hypothetical protein
MTCSWFIDFPPFGTLHPPSQNRNIIKTGEKYLCIGLLFVKPRDTVTYARKHTVIRSIIKTSI